MSASPPVNGCVERSNATERGDRAETSSGSPEKNRTTRSGRVLTTLVGAGALLAGLGGAAFAVNALLELGALVQDVVALVSHPEPAAKSRRAELAAKPPKPPKPKRAARAKPTARAKQAAASDSKPTAADAAASPESASLALNVATAPAREDIEETLLRQKLSSAAFDDAAEVSEKSRPLSVTPAPPLARVECPEVFVYIVSVVESDAKLSVASLGIGQDGPARMRHLGDRIGDWEVAAITDDWSGLRPEVWLVRGDTYCRAKLAGNPSRIHGATRAPRARPATPPPARKARAAIATAAPTAEQAAAPAAETATPPRGAALGPAKKAKKSKARRRRRR